MCRLIFGLMLLLTVGCSQLEERTTIRGQVCLGACTDAVALGGIRVELKLANAIDAPNRPWQFTDETGQFFFSNTSSTGNYLIIANHEVYVCDSITYRQHTLAEINCRLEPEAALDNDACGEVLPEANLARADLIGINLTGAELKRANLSGADLSGATLTGADLSDAQMIDARLVGADLSGRALGCQRTPDGEPTRLSSALMRGADLRDANLTGAVMTRSILTQGDLRNVDLTDAVFDVANLDHAKTGGLLGCPALLPERWVCVTLDDGRFALLGPKASLREESLTGAILEGVDLADADLTDSVWDNAQTTGLLNCPAQLPGEGWRCIAEGKSEPETFVLIGPGVDLSNANLSNADLTGTDLTGANLTNSTLVGANLTDTNLTGTNLTHVKAYNLIGCPVSLPTPWRCVHVVATSLYALIGPTANLADATLSGADLTGVNLMDADLRRTNLSSTLLNQADLRGANLAGAFLAGAELGGVKSYDLLGCPSAPLPATLLDADDCTPQYTVVPWYCAQQRHPSEGALFVLIGPAVDLTDADLSKGSFSYESVEGNNLNLTRANFTRANLAYTDWYGANLSCARWIDTICPDTSNSDGNGGTCEGHLSF